MDELITVPARSAGGGFRSRGIHHVALCVTDLDSALAFYTGVLGFDVLDRPETLPNPGAWLAVGQQQVHLLAGSDEPPRSFQHVALEVDDLVTVGLQLRARGVALHEHLVIDGYGLQAFIFDPAGNRIELYQASWPVPPDVLDAFAADAEDAR